MPKEIEAKLKKQARKLGLKGDRFNAYVYGTLQKIEEMRAKKSKREKKK